VHCGGDATGRETTRRLGQIVLQKKNLSFMFDTFLIDIITINNEAVGALVFDGKFKIIFAKKTIIATGGIGHIYKYTTNPRGAVGDGIAAALRAGAHDSMMEMIQFHPTTLITGGIEHDRLFLISEAVRGEGGILRNSEGVRFAEGKHPLNELAPRDIVTRIILDELKRSGDDRVYLDVRSMTRKFFLQRFPNIFAKCRDNGINLTDDFIPIRPAQHFLMGGIETDIDAKTAVANLYACGEAACTGIHGANRLASNSMLECLVFGNRAAQDISGNNFGTPSPDISQIDILDIKKEGEKPEGYSAAAHKHKLREIMSKYAGAVRKISELHEAKAFAENLLNLLESISLTDIADFELYSMTQTALCVINAALARKVSVGAHFVN
jgi:L-aspartate oxidase